LAGMQKATIERYRALHPSSQDSEHFRRVENSQSS
jgi:hypothetical protein